jgi:hypothetical protein
MTSDFALEMQRVIALALAEAQHQRSPILRQAQDKSWAPRTCSRAGLTVSLTGATIRCAPDEWRN